VGCQCICQSPVPSGPNRSRNLGVGYPQTPRRYCRRTRRTTCQLPPSNHCPTTFENARKELDDLYSNSPAGGIPDGDCQGTAIVSPGTAITSIKAKLTHLFGWQGKAFDAKNGRLVNKILLTGHQAIAAEVYKDKSWYDNRSASSLTTPRLLWSPNGSATRFGSARRIRI
jgi:hypothetical protein